MEGDKPFISVGKCKYGELHEAHIGSCHEIRSLLRIQLEEGAHLTICWLAIV